MAKMDKEAIEKCIKEFDGYVQPLLNDQLYMHCKGFMKIDPIIGEYKNIKSLWLQQNALHKIENLDELRELGCLYLHQNCISKIEGLSPLVNLHTLNLSQNYITKVEGLEALPHLETLLLSHNRISDIVNIKGVLACPELSTLDLSNNGLAADKDKGETPEDVIEILKQLPKLACLYIQNNELPNQTRYFRRKMVGTIKSLTYMDERPVFPEDRRATDAWMIGGFEAEQAARDEMREEKRAAEKASMAKFRAMQEAGRAKKEAAEAELEARRQSEKSWREEMKIVWERERKQMYNAEEDGRTDVWKDEKKGRTSLVTFASDSLKVALEAEAEREAQDEEKQEKLRIERQAREELEKEAAIAQERRDELRRVVKEDAALRQKELALFEEEQRMLDRFDEELLRSAHGDIDDLLKTPAVLAAAKKNAGDAPATTATKAKPVHQDPTQPPKDTPQATAPRASQRKRNIWAQYDAWERRGKSG